MFVDFLLDRFAAEAEADAIVWRDRVTSYGVLLEGVRTWMARLDATGVRPGAVVSVEADFSPASVALLLALASRGAVLVPLTSSVESKKPEFRAIAEVETTITIDDADGFEIRHTGHTATHPLLCGLKAKGHPGLILFSSGSTGASKAAVHDLSGILEKFKVPRSRKRMLVFLLFDHIGGVNTMLYALSNTGCIVTVQDRAPDAVCAAIARHRVQILPTSPTFLNLLLLSEAHERHDLSCLETVTYGTEPMPETTLSRIHELFPHVVLQQTYGLSEVGILRSKSKSSDSLWVKIGGEGFETRVVEGLLEIKAVSAMLGYLNAPSPFTADGWFQTGDAVRVDGEYFRILGRQSEMINVGGEKVYPAEVEGILQLMDGVEDVAICGEPNAITGQLVKARVRLRTGESGPEFRKRMQRFCRDHLAPFKIPQKVVLVEEGLHGGRFKKMRRE